MVDDKLPFHSSPLDAAVFSDLIQGAPESANAEHPALQFWEKVRIF